MKWKMKNLKNVLQKNQNIEQEVKITIDWNKVGVEVYYNLKIMLFISQ